MEADKSGNEALVVYAFWEERFRGKERFLGYSNALFKLCPVSNVIF
jgi:hypothetical protein